MHLHFNTSNPHWLKNDAGYRYAQRMHKAKERLNLLKHYIVAFCLSFSSIFRLAARTISSLLRFIASALSLLFADHPGELFVPVVTALSVVPCGWLILVDRLYLVMRSGLTGLDGRADVDEDVVGVAGCGICGWNEGGGCHVAVSIGCCCSIFHFVVYPYHIQSSPHQDSLRRCLHAPSIPLQVPHDSSSVQLWKHGRDLFYVRHVDLSSCIAA